MEFWLDWEAKKILKIQGNLWKCYRQLLARNLWFFYNFFEFWGFSWPLSHRFLKQNNWENSLIFSQNYTSISERPQRANKTPEAISTTKVYPTLKECDNYSNQKWEPTHTPHPKTSSFKSNSQTKTVLSHSRYFTAIKKVFLKFVLMKSGKSEIMRMHLRIQQKFFLIFPTDFFCNVFKFGFMLFLFSLSLFNATVH